MNAVDFIKQFPLKEFKKNELLLRPDESSSPIMALQTGYVKVSSYSDHENILWIAGRYDIAPTEQLFTTQRGLRYFYTAMTDGTAYVIDKKQFLDFAKQNHDLMSEIAGNMSTHYDDLLRRVDSIERMSVATKIMSTLLYLAERFNAGEDVDFYALGLPLTHSEIAAMIGSTRETTSLEMMKLKQKGLVSYDRTTFIVHVAKMKQLVG